MPKIFGIPNQIQKKQQYAILNDSKPDMFLPYVYKRFIQTLGERIKESYCKDLL